MAGVEGRAAYQEGRTLRVVGILSWFDEPDEWLEQLPITLKGVVTHLVALDGRYSRFPADHDRSPQSNYDALERGCERAGIYLETHHAGPYENDEVEKRSLHFQLAERLTTEDDWYMIIDGDMYAQTLKPHSTLRLLSKTDKLVAAACLVEDGKVQCEGFPTFFKALRGLHCDTNHYTYRAGDLLLRGDAKSDVVPYVQSPVVLGHFNKKRPKERTASAEEYYKQRQADKTEYGVCQYCEEQQACLKVPDQWYWGPNEDLRAKWFEACDRCAVTRGDGLAGELARLGARPELAATIIEQLYA